MSAVKLVKYWFRHKHNIMFLNGSMLGLSINDYIEIAAWSHEKVGPDFVGKIPNNIGLELLIPLAERCIKEGYNEQYSEITGLG